MMFPYRNIYKYIWTSPDGKIHNHINHIPVDRRRHSNVLDVRSFRAADCDSDHYLVVAKLRERKFSDTYLPIRTLLYVSFKHIVINLISFMGIPNSYEILYEYNTSLLTES
jgi:hypothetical protein